MIGLILLDKPADMTSFLACSVVRGISKEKHVGHTGTLDPMATGVLPILLGKATALSQYLTVSDKRYVATVKLGITTDTFDITGNILTESKNIPEREEIERVVASFKGKQIQTPPIYSAIQVDGRRLYDIARNGGEVEIPQREITVHSIEIVKFNPDGSFVIDVNCSKGTYIRSLASDIGKALGCGAALSALRRTVTAGFPIEKCVTLETLKQEGVEPFILPPEEAVPDMKRINVTKKQAIRFTNGGALSAERLTLNGLGFGEPAAVMQGGVMLGVGVLSEESGELRPKTVINKI